MSEEFPSVRLSVVLKPKTADFPLESVTECFYRVVRLLNEMVKQSSGKKRSSIEWKILDLSMNSPIQLHAEPFFEKDRGLASAGIENYKDFAKSISQTGRIPERFRSNAKVIKEARQLGKSMEQGLDAIELGTGTDHATITSRIINAANEAEVITLFPSSSEKTKFEYNSIKGHLRTVEDADGNFIVLLQDEMSGDLVRCVFEDWTEVTKISTFPFSQQRVSLYGKICYGGDRPKSIEVIHHERLPDREPNAFSLIKGLNLTGGLSAVKHLAEIRGNG